MALLEMKAPDRFMAISPSGLNARNLYHSPLNDGMAMYSWYTVSLPSASVEKHLELVRVFLDTLADMWRKSPNDQGSLFVSDRSDETTQTYYLRIKYHPLFVYFLDHFHANTCREPNPDDLKHLVGTRPEAFKDEGDSAAWGTFSQTGS